VVLAGQSNVTLAEDLAQRAGAAVGVSRLEASASGAPRVDFGVGVAGKDVVIVQTSRPDPGAAVQHSTMAHLAEALLLFQSAVERGARDVKLVLPYMTNARSDKIDQKGVAAYGSLVARWIDAVVDEGRKVADARGQRTGFRPRVVLVEPHDQHTPYFFRTPVDVVSGGAVLATRVIDDVGKDGLVLVRPDEGAAKRTAVLGKQLGLPVVNGQKSRADNNETATIDQLGSKSDVDGKKTLIIDDEIATGGTMRKTVAHLRALGATEVHVAVTHANMPLVPEERHEAMRKLKEAGASRLYLMDTQPVGAVPADLRDFVVVVPSADAIATTARLAPRGAPTDQGDDA
jgi:ribose-phosphate pyrophosphokinase